MARRRRASTTDTKGSAALRALQIFIAPLNGVEHESEWTRTDVDKAAARDRHAKRAAGVKFSVEFSNIEGLRFKRSNPGTQLCIDVEYVCASGVCQ